MQFREKKKPLNIQDITSAVNKMINRAVVHGAMGFAKKSFKLVWLCHQLLSRFLANGQLPRVSRQSRISANDKSDNEMIPRAVQRSPGIYLTAEENT